MLMSTDRSPKTGPQDTNTQIAHTITDAHFPKILIVVYHKPCSTLLSMLIPLQNVQTLIQTV